MINLKNLLFEDEQKSLTPIKDIPNVQNLVKSGQVTYRGLGSTKLAKDFSKLSDDFVFRLNVNGKEYFITNSDLDKLKKLGRIEFAAPFRKSS